MEATVLNVSNPEEAVDALLANAAEKRALSDPLPGPLADAFLKPEIVVAGITVRPVVASTWVFLKAIKSPMISAIADVVQDGKVDTEITEQESWEICWLFTHTPKECREMLSQGVAPFKEMVTETIGDASPAYPWQIVFSACLVQIKRHMETAIKQTADVEGNDDVRFFLDSRTKVLNPAVGS